MTAQTKVCQDINSNELLHFVPFTIKYKIVFFIYNKFYTNINVK